MERGIERVVFKFVCLSGFVYELLRSKLSFTELELLFPLFFNESNWIHQGKLQRLRKKKKKRRDSKKTEMGGMVRTDICMGRTENRVNDSCLGLER